MESVLGSFLSIHDTIKVLLFVPHLDLPEGQRNLALPQLSAAALDMHEGSVKGFGDKNGRDYHNPAAYTRHEALHKERYAQVIA